ncbi:hypothetical protein ACSMXN_05660 [Jatrophihabitans sp. DSM 45814]
MPLIETPNADAAYPIVTAALRADGSFDDETKNVLLRALELQALGRLDQDLFRNTNPRTRNEVSRVLDEMGTQG